MEISCARRVQVKQAMILPLILIAVRLRKQFLQHITVRCINQVSWLCFVDRISRPTTSPRPKLPFSPSITSKISIISNIDIMKVSQLLYSLSFPAILVSASPTSPSLHGSKTNFTSFYNKDLIPRDGPDVPYWCTIATAVLGLVQQVEPEYRAYFYATGALSLGPGVAAWKFCDVFRGENNPNRKCESMGIAVGGVVGSISAGVSVWHR